jgi:hypothetical protein
MWELSFRWQDGAIQVLTYALIITAGLWILSKIEIKDKEEDNG